MNCVSSEPQEDLVSAYIDNEVGRRDRIAVEAHLLECESCRKLHSQLKERKRIIRSLNDLDVSSLIWERSQREQNNGSTIRTLLHHLVSAVTRFRSRANLKHK